MATVMRVTLAACPRALIAAIALGLILGSMAFEATVGILANSLALLSDAHTLTDATAIGLSLVALRLAQRPAKRHDPRVQAHRDPLGTVQRRDAARSRFADRLRGHRPPDHTPNVAGVAAVRS